MSKKFLQDEILSENELENVAGGTIFETLSDGEELYKRGLLSFADSIHSTPVRETLHKMGYTDYKDNGGITNGNIYTDKNGNQISRKEFWKNFDKENNTKIING